MRRILILLLVAAVVAGCADKSKKSTTPAQEAKQVVGGYDKPTPPTHKELQIFRLATRDMEEQYVPFRVSRQVVAGTNFRFVCRSATRNKPPRMVIVNIFAPLPNSGQPPRVVSVEEMPKFGRKYATTNSR